ncbi:MAG: DedA family protein [Christensenellaceae bacterium]|jgi:membrane protein DedA with SNARE-associated domain|nr:DedA family protein [Christensenellaceae bacterium]
MKDIIINIINKFGYSGIFALIAIENLFPPIPSEVILTFAGFATTISNLNYIWAIVAATAGSMLGAIVLYLIGRILKADRLEKLVEGKFGKIFRLKKTDIQKSNAWFTKHGEKAIFIGRFIPIIRSLVSIPAGISGMRLIYFIPLTLAGTLIWNTALVLLGRAAGTAWEKIAGYLDIYSLVALVIIMILLAIGVVVFVKLRIINPRQKKNEASQDEIKINVTNHNSIEVTIEQAGISGLEYKVDDGEWQEDSKFTDFADGKNYIIYVKYMTTDGTQKNISLKYLHMSNKEKKVDGN